MKLTKDINIKIYEVLTDYKVKVTSSPFIAILKFAEENGGEITSNQLYNDFLQPLSEKASENILDRLTSMGYFEKDNAYMEEAYEEKYYDDNFRDSFSQRNIYDGNNNYILTELGYTSAQQEEFYENRNGILKIYLADSEFIEQIVVKIEEKDRQETFKKEDLKDIKYTELYELQNSNQYIILENGTYILDNFKDKCRTFTDERKPLILETNETGGVMKLLDFEKLVEQNTNEVKSIILQNEHLERYDKDKQILKIDFNPKHLELQRNIKVQEPIVGGTHFQPVQIESVKLSPINSNEALVWFKTLVIQKINIYFLSEKEFNEFANKISQEFELFSKELKNSISKEETIEELDKEKNFYKKAKLETIDYLNY